jgi:hypothetical protein
MLLAKKKFLSLAVVAVFALQVPAVLARKNPPAPSPRGNVAAITADQMRDYLNFIASDELEGRDTPSRGLNIAALYIASLLSRWGLKPAGDNGSYFQRFPVKRKTIDAAQTTAEINGQTFRFGTDFVAQLDEGVVSAPIVYAGHGWMVKSKKRNAYEGIDIRGKIVVHHGGCPNDQWIIPDDLKGKKGVDWDDPAGYALRHGAVGRIVIPTDHSSGDWNKIFVQGSETGFIEYDGYSNQEASIPTIIIDPRMTNALFAGEKQVSRSMISVGTYDFFRDSFDLKPENRIIFKVALKSKDETTQNVVAVIEGSDPVLKKEYVAIGAHYDHVGVGTPVKGDEIYNGADDDGSGTVAVMAMAEAASQGPRPKRSLLFVWHAGEEQGLWGSDYFTRSPVVPVSQIIAQLNIDMIGRARRPGETPSVNKWLAEKDEVFVIGSRMMSTELGELSESVNRSYLNLKFNYKYDDPNDPEKFFFRSDHFNYAQKGIPVIFYMDGDHDDYHKPSDSIEKIDFDQMEKIARTIYATAWELANRPIRPRVDKKLPFEIRK